MLLNIKYMEGIAQSIVHHLAAIIGVISQFYFHNFSRWLIAYFILTGKLWKNNLFFRGFNTICKFKMEITYFKFTSWKRVYCGFLINVNIIFYCKDNTSTFCCLFWNYNWRYFEVQIKSNCEYHSNNWTSCIVFIEHILEL